MYYIVIILPVTIQRIHNESEGQGRVAETYMWRRSMNNANKRIVTFAMSVDVHAKSVQHDNTLF